MNKNSIIKGRIFASRSLKTFREAKGYTQSDVKSMVELESGIPMSASTYQKIEQGSLSVSANIALDIAKILKADVMDLFVRLENDK